jgi:hypothetical protein
VSVHALADTGLSAPDSKAGKLQRACLALLKQHEREGTIPTNGRFLFYELEQQGIVPKHYLDAQGNERARTPSQDISDALLRLRKLGQVPWWWLLDETRDVSTWRYSASVYEYVAESVKLARIDCWGGELPPLIICEARATRGVLERIAAEYLCPITATGGQSAGHIVNEIVPLLRGNNRKVLYIGDCEERGPGDQIEANTRRYVEEHTGRTFAPSTWIKVALTPEQVARSPRLRRLAIKNSIVAAVRHDPTAQSNAKRSGRPCWNGCCARCSTRCCPSRWPTYRYARNASSAPCLLRSPKWEVGHERSRSGKGSAVRGKWTTTCTANTNASSS